MFYNIFSQRIKKRKMKVGNIQEILNPKTIWAIDKAFADANLFKVIQILNGHNEAIIINDNNSENLNPKCSISDSTLRWEQYRWKEFDNVAENSILAIDIYSVITKYDQQSGAQGMQSLADIVRRGNENSNISSILLYISSGGGNSYAAHEMVTALQETSKPTIAFVDDFAASAAYWIASACDQIIVNSNLAQVGSIGTYTTLVDYSEKLKMEGIKIHEVYAEQSTEKNEDVKKALEGDYSGIIEGTNKFNDTLLSTISAFRGDKLKSDAWKTGKMFFAAEALEIGLIDNIASFSELLKSLKSL